MSLVQQLLEKEKYIILNYYGLNDMSTAFDMKEIVDNKEIICNYYKLNHDMKISSIDEYIDYNFAVKIKKMKEIIPNIIDEEKKEHFIEVVTIVEEYLNTIAISDVIKYLNSDYAIVFNNNINKNILGIVDVTVIFFSYYIRGIKKEVIEYLIENKSYLIVNHYDIFGGVIENDEALSNIFWSEAIISPLFLQQQKQIQKILEKLYIKGKLKNFEQIIDLLSNIVEQKFIEINDNNILANETYIRQFYEFLSNIKHINANKFRDYYERTSDMMDAYLKVNGYHSSYEIPVGEIVDFFKKIEPKEYSLLFISHGRKDGRIISNLDQTTNGERSLVDFVSTNHKYSKSYT